MSDHITADEIANMLGVSRNTVYQYASRGEIPHRRLGRRCLFSREAITRWFRGDDGNQDRR